MTTLLAETDRIYRRGPGRPRAEETPHLRTRNEKIVGLWRLGVPVPVILKLVEVSRSTAYRVIQEAREPLSQDIDDDDLSSD